MLLFTSAEMMITKVGESNFFYNKYWQSTIIRASHDTRRARCLYLNHATL